MKAGLSDVLLFVIPFFVFGLVSIFFQESQFLPMKQGLSDVLPL
jgi:intracellular septation protein A